MSERLIPVKSEAELRVGMIVVHAPCDNNGCGGTHRAILLKQFRGVFISSEHRLERRPAWKWSPGPSCDPEAQALDAAMAIRDGRLFRVDDGMDAEPTIKFVYVGDEIHAVNAKGEVTVRVKNSQWKQWQP